MTLSLDDVRNKRFRMARKSGYEVLEVDEFVDEVEETFAQLLEENTNLTKQVEALRSASGTTPSSAPAVDSAGPAAGPGERIVVTTSAEASPAVVRLVQMSTEQAERLVAEATAEATRIREHADASAAEVTGEAQDRAKRLEVEARAAAERLQADAAGRAQLLDRETAARRQQMLGALEQQRDQLTGTVRALREFEAHYRSNLTRHLQDQIEVLAAGREEPADPPAALQERRTAAGGNGATAAAARTGEGGPAGEPQASPAPGGTSETPRLDALLGDQQH